MSGSLIGVVAAWAQSSDEKPTKEPIASYYMIIFGAQDEQSNPLTSHCFATFIKLIENDADTNREVASMELRHINWFTKRGRQVGAPDGLLTDGVPEPPEPGENLDTTAALENSAQHRLTVYRFGPYEIDEILYQRAVRQIARLEGHAPGQRILYKQLDFGLREGANIVASNCIHAISDIVREPKPLNTGLAFGREAAQMNVLHLRRWIKNPDRVHQDVWERSWKMFWRTGSPPANLRLLDCTVPGIVAQRGSVSPKAAESERRPAEREEWARLAAPPRRGLRVRDALKAMGQRRRAN